MIVIFILQLLLLFDPVGVLRTMFNPHLSPISQILKLSILILLYPYNPEISYSPKFRYFAAQFIYLDEKTNKGFSGKSRLRRT
jgi:hypothetical protein